MKQKEFQEFVIKNFTSLNERMTAQEKFQEFAVKSFTSLNKRMTAQEKFQELAVKHLMNLSSDVKSLKGSVSSLEGRFSSLENTVLEWKPAWKTKSSIKSKDSSPINSMKTYLNSMINA